MGGYRDRGNGVSPKEKHGNPLHPPKIAQDSAIILRTNTPLSYRLRNN